MKLKIILTTTVAAMLICGLTACIGQDESPAGHSSNDPSHWVTRSWVGDNAKPQQVVTKTDKPSSNWLASKFSQLARTNTSTGNLWDRLPNGFAIDHHSETPEVQAQLRWFLNHQDYLDRTTQRAAPYMYYIQQQVQRRNMPTELVLLPIIESAYNPFNYSNRGAAGLWQLMPGTGSDWGVKQNWWYDGRRDIFASTNAALDYLTYLQNYFDGNWMLAIAAYNCGPGTVQAAIRKNIRYGRPTDFWSLPLPQETRAYVPRLLALASIVQDRERYQVYLPSIEDRPYIAQIDVGSQIDLAHAAKLANMSLNELRQLNPGYNHTATEPNGSSILILPIAHIDGFKENLALMSREEKLSYQKYKVRHGDTLASIADRFDLSASQLRETNHLRTNHVLPGKSLLIPVVALAVTDKPIKPAVNKDMVDVIANNNITSQTSELVETETVVIANNNSENSEAENRTIAENFIDTPPSTPEPEQTKHVAMTSNIYHVKSGDTLYKIAKQNHVSVDELAKANHLSHNAVKPGMTLTIPTKMLAKQSVSIMPSKTTATHKSTNKTGKTTTHNKKHYH